MSLETQFKKAAHFVAKSPPKEVRMDAADTCFFFFVSFFPLLVRLAVLLSSRLFSRFSQGISNDDKLKTYALYKQATEGDCNTAQPWAVQLEARAKHDAWSANKGMSKDDAMKAYIERVAKDSPDWEKSEVAASFAQ